MENKKGTEAQKMTREDFAALWKTIHLKITDTYDVPPEILWVNGSTIGTLGNFSASTGKAKSKKTFNVSAVVAAALKDDEVLQYSAFLPENKRKILYVDTEQSKYHCHKVMERIMRLAGLPTNKDREDFIFVVLRECTPDKRKQIIDYMLANMEDIGLVIIDGIRDLMYDINSPSESSELINLLMKWSSEYNLHIHTVLHLNKGDDNTRGHIGTELNNKAETVLQVTKSTQDVNISEVKAMHIRDTTTAQYYRDLKRQTGELETDVQQLHSEKKEAEKRLLQVKREIGTERLEVVKTETKTALIAKVGSLLGSGEIKELKQENRQLRNEVVARDESIERLQIMMQEQREQHSRELMKAQGKHIKELDEAQKEISRMSQMIKKACAWLPLLKELFRMERLCRVVGFSTEQTAKLMLGEKIEHNGTLYSEEYKRNFATDKVTVQIVTDSTVGKNKLMLIINRKNVSDWFREQFSKLYQRIQPKEEHKKSKGFSL